MEGAREPAAVARKAKKTTTEKIGEDKDTSETGRPLDTTAPSNTKQTEEAAAMETMMAFGEAVKAMEDAMGTKNKATNMTTNDKTKNLGNIVYATELNAGIKTPGLANLARDLITACNYENKNVKLKLIKVDSGRWKVESNASSQNQETNTGHRHHQQRPLQDPNKKGHGPSQQQLRLHQACHRTCHQRGQRQQPPPTTQPQDPQPH